MLSLQTGRARRLCVYKSAISHSFQSSCFPRRDGIGPRFESRDDVLLALNQSARDQRDATVEVFAETRDLLRHHAGHHFGAVGTGRRRTFQRRLHGRRIDQKKAVYRMQTDLLAARIQLIFVLMIPSIPFSLRYATRICLFRSPRTYPRE